MSAKINSAIAKTLAASVLVTSCTPNADLDNVENQITTNPEKDFKQGKGVSISLSLSEETKKALLEIAPLVQEIIDNPTIAREFSQNPEVFCKNRGYNFVIDLDDAIFKVIAALGNDEINTALQNNDFEKFMQVCADMGLLNAEQKVSLNTIFENEEEHEIFNAIAHELNGESIESRSVAMAAVVTVLVAIAIILVFTVGFEHAEEMQPANLNLNDEQSEDSLIYSHNTSQVFLHCSNPNSAILDVWALRNRKINDYQLVSSYKNFLSNQIVSYLKNKKPEILERYSEIQLSEFLKRNMVV